MLTLQFQSWYAHEVSKQYSKASVSYIQPDDLSIPRMKCPGGQWVMKPFNNLPNNSQFISNGFLAAHIPQWIDAGKPVLQDMLASDEEDDDYEYSKEDSYEEGNEEEGSDVDL